MKGEVVHPDVSDGWEEAFELDSSDFGLRFAGSFRFVHISFAFGRLALEAGRAGVELF